MATTIQNLHSLSAGNQPGDLLPGQIAYNLADGFVYLGNGGDNYLDTLGNVIGPATEPGQGWQQAIFNASPINGSAILGGLYDAQDNLVTSVTAAGTTAGLAAGSPLPAAGSGNTDVYVLVQIGGTMAPPAPTGDAEAGDWIISTGTAWSLVSQSNVTIPAQNVTVVPSGGVQSTNVQSALVELDIEKYSVSGGSIGGKVIIDTGLADADALVIQSGGGAQIEGLLDVGGAVTLGDDLTVTGAAVVGGSLTAAGVTSNGAVVVTGAVTATAGVTGATGTFGTLAVSSTSNFTGAITSNILSVAQSLNVGTAAGGDSMVVQAASSFSQPVTVSSTANFSGANTFSGLNTTTFTSATTLNVQGKFQLASAVGSTIGGVDMSNLLVPLGAIIAMPLAAVPTNGDWQRCEGQAISRATYASLFTLIGTIYGAGDGSTTFNLPDYRGLFMRGWSQNGTVTTAGGAKAGAPARNVGSTQIDAFASHSHTIGPNTNWKIVIDSINQGGSSGATSTGNVRYENPTTNTAGGSETIPVNVAVCYIMRVK